MLTRNLWVQKDLCNGSVGVVNVIFHEQTPPCLPIAIIVRFYDTYTSPRINTNELRCVPAIPQVFLIW